jgi:hypothetical protein
MKKLDLNKQSTLNEEFIILIFTEGTIIGPSRFVDFFNMNKYLPIKNCISKIDNWHKQGAQIIYLTSRKNESSVQIIKNLLLEFRFPGSYLYYRENSEKYKNIVEALKPNILIEDNCRSIGGSWQMSITHVEKKIRENIKSIIVEEFKGIDNLPDNLNDLMNY